MLIHKPIDQIAQEVIEGKWGNGQERIDRLRRAGYDYKLVQMRVDRLMASKPAPAKPAPAPVHAPAGRPVPPPPPPAGKPLDVVAKEVIDGKWGNGQDRIDRLTRAGYDYKAVQNRVNQLLGGAKPAPAPAPAGRPVPPPPPPAKKPVDVIAREVIQGKWGNGQERIDRLTRAGYDYKTVQSAVNKLL